MFLLRAFAVCKFSSAHLILFSRHRCAARQCRVLFRPWCSDHSPSKCINYQRASDSCCSAFQACRPGFSAIVLAFLFLPNSCRSEVFSYAGVAPSQPFLNEEHLFQKLLFDCCNETFQIEVIKPLSQNEFTRGILEKRAFQGYTML